MKPAARITDMHTCPMVTGTVPHVGGPILPPGAVTVTIGGLPAARVGDMAVCAGPPDSIVMGSMGVFIEGKPAARLGDPTVHGGVIVAGCPTVLVGDICGGAASLQGLTMSAARAAGAPFTAKCPFATQHALLSGKPKKFQKGIKRRPKQPKAASKKQPVYPRALLLSNGRQVTQYTRYIQLTGTAEEQANAIRQLDAIRKDPSGSDLLASIDTKGRVTTIKVHGNAARGREIHPDPPQQSYQNCAVQSAQQLIRQATGKNYSESEMETLANKPKRSGYDRDDGTPIKGVQTVLENGGVRASRVNAKTENIKKALARGKGVITAHDAGGLWNDPDYAGSGHAVVTTAFIEDGEGNTLGFVVNDTGTGQKGRTIAADRYAKSLMKGRTVTVTRKKIW